MDRGLIDLIAIAVQTGIFLLGVYAMVLYNKWSNRNLEEEVREMKTELKELAKVIIQQAVQTKEIENLREQLTMTQRNVEDLRRGNGFVRGRHGIDGEYP